MSLADYIRIVADHYALTDAERKEVAAAVRGDLAAARESYEAMAREIVPGLGINERIRASIAHGVGSANTPHG